MINSDIALTCHLEFSLASFLTLCGAVFVILSGMCSDILYVVYILMMFLAFYLIDNWWLNVGQGTGKYE